MRVYSFTVYLSIQSRTEKYVVADSAESATQKIEKHMESLGIENYFIMPPSVVSGMESVIL